MPQSYLFAQAAVFAQPIFAGMPAPIPFKTETFERLSSTWLAGAQTISFFSVALLLSAVVVRWLWNSLAQDVAILPRLSFRGAISGVALWGLGFVVVLTMIAGARELMTPGAWVQKGATYQLRSATAVANPNPDDSETTKTPGGSTR